MFKARIQLLHPAATATKTAHGWDVRAGHDVLGQGSSAAAAWHDAYLSCFPAPSASTLPPPPPKPQQVGAAQPAKVPHPTWPFPCSTRPELQAQHDAYRAAPGTAGAARTGRSS